jgi:hypothetical protein
MSDPATRLPRGWFRRFSGLVTRRLGCILLLIHLSSVPGLPLGLEETMVIIPRGTDTGLLSPRGFYFDSFRGLFIIANTEAHRVEILNREGDSINSLGKGGTLRLPLAVVADRDGTLFIALKESESLMVLPEYDAAAGEDYQDLDLSAHRRRTAVQVVSLAIDSEGNLHVADRGNRQILVFDRNRNFQFAIPDVGEPTDMAAGAGALFVADPGFGGIRVYDRKGKRQATLGIEPGRFAEPLRIKAMVVDRRERLWLLEEADRGLKVLDSFGNLLADLPFSAAAGAEVFSAIDLALEPDFFLYVLEKSRGRIRVLRIHEF